MATAPDSFQSADPRARKLAVKSQLIELGLLAGPLRVFSSGEHEPYSTPNIRIICQGLSELGGVFAAFANYLGTRVDLFTLSDCVEFFGVSPHQYDPVITPCIDNPNEASDGAANCAIASIEPLPFEESAQFKLFHAKLESGKEVVVKQKIAFDKPETDLLRLLERPIGIHLCQTASFRKVINDFRESYKASQNYPGVAERLESLSRQTTDYDPLVIPEVYTSAGDSDHIVTERISGIRLDHYLDTTQKTGGPFYDGLEPALGYIPEEIARLLCDGWLHMAINCGIVPVEFDARDIVILSSNRIAFTGGSFQELGKSVPDRIRQYLINSCNNDSAKALQALLPVCDVQNVSALSDIERLFRQLVPFAQGGWDDDGEVNSSSETIFAQLRLLQDQRITLVPAARETMRGLFCVARLARQLSPVRDSFREGIKDLRLLGLLESAREILDPVHWTSQTDKFIGLMMLAPKHFDHAIDTLNIGEQQQKQQQPESAKPRDWLALVLSAIAGFLLLKYTIPVLGAIAERCQRAFEQINNWL